MVHFWNFLLERARSDSTAQHIRANLLLHHQQECEEELKVLTNTRDELRLEVEGTQASLAKLDAELAQLKLELLQTG
jgi:hypothetical protein